MSVADTASDVHYTIGVRPVSVVDDIHIALVAKDDASATVRATIAI